MKKVITYGTFDLLHVGHINILRKAKAMGDYLTVAVSSDEFNEIKGKKAHYNLEHRIEIIKSIKYVDKVIVEHSWDQKIHDILHHDIDIFVMGDDWKGKFDYLKEYCEVVYLPRTKGVSSSKIKANIYGDKND